MPLPDSRKNRRGFTLVELAIVLVIIGLIVGGVLVGRDLINTAELRNILSDIEKYQAAVGTFRNKYNAIPGRMRNATAIWGAADADPTLCVAALTGGTATCDSTLTVDGFPAGGNYTFWQQLGAAGLIGFTPTGAETDGFVPGSTIPTASSRSDIGYVAAHMGTVPDSDDAFGGQYGYVFFLMGAGTNYKILSTADAFWIDTKKDDGTPAGGAVVSLKGGGAPATATPNCTTTAVASTAEYDLSLSTAECSLIFKKAF